MDVWPLTSDTWLKREPSSSRESGKLKIIRDCTSFQRWHIKKQKLSLIEVYSFVNTYLKSSNKSTRLIDTVKSLLAKLVGDNYKTLSLYVENQGDILPTA